MQCFDCCFISVFAQMPENKQGVGMKSPAVCWQSGLEKNHFSNARAAKSIVPAAAGILLAASIESLILQTDLKLCPSFWFARMVHCLS